MCIVSPMEKSRAHVVLFPFPGQGHNFPFLSLATRLHHYWSDFTITLVSIPHNIGLIRTLLPPDSRLQLHSLPFYPAVHGLPASAESPADLPVTQFITFLKATETLYPSFDDFISNLVSNVSNHDPLCIVSDFFFGWTVDIARKYKVFHTTFVTMGAFGGAVLFSMWLNVPHPMTESNSFSLPEYPEVIFDRSEVPKNILESDGTDERCQFFKGQIIFLHKTNAMLINTVEEFELLGLGMLRKTLNFPILPIGPPLANQSSSLQSEEETTVMTFLDLQPPASVLYISFGSHNRIQHEQMMNLAQGLQDSGCSFIWVIRPPIGSDPRGGFRDEWLPHGFQERIQQKNVGLLIHGWAPQVKILGHSSTRAFLSHCGWNSIIESMSHGVPIVAWPLIADQIFNSKMLTELCLGVELAKGVLESSVPTKEKVEKVVDLVMGSNAKGMEIRKRAKECRDVINKAWDEEGGSSTKSFLEFVQLINTAAGNE